MKFILSIAIIFLLIILQSSLYPFLNVYNAFPNLILIIVLILSILGEYKQKLIWIIVGGFLLDIYSFNNYIGTSILALFLIGYLAKFFSKNIFKETSIFSIILITIGGTLIYRLFLFQFVFPQLISQIIYNLIVLVPLFYLIKRSKNA